MTKAKQIIIDGVDVSDLYPDLIACMNRYEVARLFIKTVEQLKRKEQECEELRQYHNKCCEEFEKEKKEWLEKYNQVSRDFYSGKYCNAEKCQQLDQLKAENKKIEQCIIEQNRLVVGMTKEIETLTFKKHELLQTLTEIKEIAEINPINTCWTFLELCEECDENKECDIQCPLFKFKLILQKINEVLPHDNQQ